jgi:hypothetical protein
MCTYFIIIIIIIIIITIKPLLCYIVKHLFYIPPVLLFWRHTASQAGALANGVYSSWLSWLGIVFSGRICFKE